MEQIGHYINGEHVAGTSGRTADVFNPATGEVQAQVALANQAEMDAAVAVAAAAQPAWAAQNPQKRARVMMKMVELLHREMALRTVAIADAIATLNKEAGNGV